MKTRCVLLSLLGVYIASAQTPSRSSSQSSVNPCPGGAGVAILDTITVPSLDSLVRWSDLIVVGTVVNVLPAFNTDPNLLNSIETDSLVSITEKLWGTVPNGSGPILLSQMAGKAGPCSITIQDDPLVKSGEQYVLFLIAENRKQVPNTSGTARYSAAVGVWSGKVKVADGEIQFPARANSELHKYHNTDQASFLTTLRDVIQELSGLNLLHSNAPVASGVQ